MLVLCFRERTGAPRRHKTKRKEDAPWTTPRRRRRRSSTVVPLPAGPRPCTSARTHEPSYRSGGLTTTRPPAPSRRPCLRGRAGNAPVDRPPPPAACSAGSPIPSRAGHSEQTPPPPHRRQQALRVDAVAKLSIPSRSGGGEGGGVGGSDGRAQTPQVVLSPTGAVTPPDRPRSLPSAGTPAR